MHIWGSLPLWPLDLGLYLAFPGRISTPLGSETTLPLQTPAERAWAANWFLASHRPPPAPQQPFSGTPLPATLLSRIPTSPCSVDPAEPLHN